MRIQDQIHRIMWDRRYVVIPDGYGSPVSTVLLRDPNIEDRNYYLHIKASEEARARAEKVPTEGEIFASAKAGGYWTENDELIIAKADEHIEFLRGEAKRKGFAARRRQIESQIRETEAQKREVEQRRQELLATTADYHAHVVAVSALLRRVVLDTDGNLMWPTEQEFIEFRNYHPDVVQYLMHEMLSEGLWETSDIRAVARNIEWRLLWSLSRENLDGLFNRPIGDLNFNQRLLVYWSRVYDNAFEDPKPPDRDVIEDDDKFDEWLANRDLERKEESEGRRNKNSVYHHQEQMAIIDGEYIDVCTCGIGPQNRVGLGMRKPHAQGCRYGVWRPYSRREKDEIADRVYGRNTKNIRRYLDKEQDRVLKAGMVQEQHLRDKHARKIIGANTNVIPIYKRR